MNQRAGKYARILWEMQMPERTIQEASDLYNNEVELRRVLNDPTVYKEQKHAVVGRIFPEEIRNFMNMLCDLSELETFPEVVEAYEEIRHEAENVIYGTLRYVTPPDEEKIAGMKSFLKKQFGAENAELELIQDKNIIGGFILSANGQEWDWSLKARIAQMTAKLNRR